jgi:hypothetical protein
MGRLTSTFLTAATALAGCSTLPGPGNLDPMPAAKVCAAGLGVPFGPEGHLYTILSVADIAGYKPERQFALAYFSQYPDLDSDYEAVHVSIKYLLVPWRWTWRNDVTGVLHSLHGGNRDAVEKRREQIRRAIARSIADPDRDWLTGILMHAYGDAYAHTKGELGASDEAAYGVWTGHAIPSLFGDDPDDIKNPRTEPKYFAYIDDLYRTIRTEHASDDRFSEFKTFIRNLKCENGRCPNFHELFANRPTGNARIDRFADCMNRSARRLTPAEIQLAMDTIKDFH